MSKKYICEKCKKEFNRKYNFERHCKKCKDKVNNKYMCCGKDFKTKQRYNAHINTIKHLNALKGITKVIHKCLICDYKTKYSSHLKKHKQTHIKKKKDKIEELSVKKHKEQEKRRDKIMGYISKYRSRLKIKVKGIKTEKNEEKKNKLKTEAKKFSILLNKYQNELKLIDKYFSVF